MVFLEQGVRMEHIILEWLDIDAIKRDESVCAHDIHTWGDDAVCAGHVGSKATQVSRGLLKVTEVLG